MNAYYFIVVPAMAIMCIVFAWIIAGDKYDSIRHKMGSRSYGNAAVFIGTACLFIGTPEECDDVADGLWHHAQQAEVRALTGDETFDIL